MFWKIFYFELKYHFRRPLLYIFGAIFFLMTFGAVSTDSIMLGGSIGNVFRNAPIVIINMLSVMSLFGLLFVTIFVAPAVNRDHDHGIQELFFSTPLTKGSYLWGRFAGSVLPIMLASLLSGAGIVAASLMPYQNPEHIAPFTLWPYLYAFFIFTLPNMFLAGAIFFSASSLSGKTFSAYVAVVVFLSLWGISQAFIGDLESQSLVSLIDPFGWNAFSILTRYWTVVERNTKMLPLGGILLLNRLIWILGGALILILTTGRYRMVLGQKGARSVAAAEAPAPGEGAASASRLDPSPSPLDTSPSVSLSPVLSPDRASRRGPDFSPRSRLIQYFRLTGMEAGNILRSLPFMIIALMGAANLIAGMFIMRGGSISFPLTQEMIRSIRNGFELMVLLTIIIYSAELIWKDRRVRIHEINDASPVPDWMVLSSKIGSLWIITLLMCLLAVCCTIGYQLSRGYFHLEPALYFKGVFLILALRYLLLCVLALFLQVVTGNRHLGTLLMVIYFVLIDVLPGTGLNHHLYLFGTTPPAPYSDMNGYGHFTAPLFWFNLYWAFLAASLAVLAGLLMIRGEDIGILVRLRRLRGRLRPV
ncbi:MAG: ABC transporter permease, partial [Candidatus Krumholzibacteriota bacterium]|nr:ABC transporter permease [Candidatus Krumholzibacteriota bacterium]